MRTFYAIEVDYSGNGPNYIPETDVSSRGESFNEALARVKRFTRVAEVYECQIGGECKPVAEKMALAWRDDLIQDGWQDGDEVPDFLVRHLPARINMGYAGPKKEMAE